MPELSQRLFFALFPPPTLHDQIAQLAQTLTQGQTGKPLHDLDLHITLVFLGDIPVAKIPCLQQVADNIRATPFAVSLNQFGYWEKPRILWLAPDEPIPALNQLVQQLTDKLTQHCAYQAEKRPYRAHMTLYRHATPCLNYPTIDPLIWQAQEFCLVRSNPQSTKNRYEIIQRWQFQTTP
ncbi:2''-5'' RNA ligase [Beggiatoa alba B18LD]|uniref:RNA 2',3'-cyclic phosphodiesterase n=1 Tax=Beggiatoa alba B18LD TaxID=395493 RepID=I3CCD7_9GAMM|nr:RNA 2',3'-cyclic phosphodiesterase [Beggiatoa alba]EIJ41280.1 2''-5'' RNA ligase [Beggiatoa alba B18LD]